MYGGGRGYALEVGKLAGPPNLPFAEWGKRTKMELAVFNGAGFCFFFVLPTVQNKTKRRHFKVVVHDIAFIAERKMATRHARTKACPAVCSVHLYTLRRTHRSHSGKN